MAQTPYPCPRRLYKYMPPQRIDVLANARFRFSPLSAFNDPFEGRPEITDLSPEPELKATLQTVLDEEARRAYDGYGDALRAAMDFDTFKRWMMEASVKMEPGLRQHIQGLLPGVRAALASTFENRIGTLSLSEVPDSLLMWAHYAASHSGFVLELDAHHPYFHAQVSPEDELRHLRRVMYRDGRPSVALTSLDPGDLFLVKSSHWAYEREWRILRAFDDATETVDVGSEMVHLFSFPQAVVTAVILGARMDTKVASSIADILKTNSSYSHVRLMQAVPDESHFLLRISESAI